MSYNFIVLCPNGRRENVKTTANSSVLQILEEACRKRGLNSEEFDVMHYNRVLDLSLPIRFANLPNNAQLELKPAKNSRKESKVTVALQLESGERITNDFTSSATIQDVLEKSFNAGAIVHHEGKEPVCVYMRQKITGGAIKTTSLKSLGLTQGSAIIRLLYRKPDDIEEQAHVSAPLTAPRKEDKIASEQISSSSGVNTNHSQPHSSTSPKNEELVQVPGNSVFLAGETEWERQKISDVDHSVKCDEDHGNVEVYNTAMDSQQVTPVECDDKRNLGYPVKEEVVVKEELNQMEWNEEVDDFQGIGDIKYIGERHAVLYSLDDITSKKKADLPDEFFELTVNDVRYLMAEYTKQRAELENQPLLTKEQRQKQLLQKLAKYSKTVIRIYFPERLVLQAVFHVIETVETVADFVRTFIEDPSTDFYLYTTPPKQKLNVFSTLIEALLVPAAVVHFGCDKRLASRYLRRELSLSDPRAASLAASQARKECITGEPIATESIEPSTSKSVKDEELHPETVTSTSVQPLKKPLQSSGKVPKWFKTSNK